VRLKPPLGIPHVFCGIFASLFIFSHAHALDLGFAKWDGLLKKTVVITNNGKDSAVKYAEVKASPAELNSILADWAKFPRSEFDKLGNNDQMAFLINVYNAATISLIAQNYPITSIKKLGIPLVGPWKKNFIQLLGETLSLDTIEHGMLRKNYKLAAIHFGVNCASVSCPPLRAEAFTGAKLSDQLDSQAALFFSNTRENNFDATARVLTLNPILKWFNEDFSTTGDSGTVTYVSKYFPDLSKALASGKSTSDIKVRYGDYNWNLNDVTK
jgi:Protein of unknown function, DUF547